MKELSLLPVIILFFIQYSFQKNESASSPMLLEDTSTNLSSEEWLKIDALMPIIDNFAHKRSIKLLPGIILETGGYQSGRWDNETFSRGSLTFDKFICREIQQFFSSVSLKIKVVDNDTMEKITRLTSDLTSLEESRGFSPRIRPAAAAAANNMNTTVLLGALISAATMLAMTLSALSAMAGKAVAMSTVSLGLAMMGSHGHGHGHGGWNGNHGKAVEVHHTHSTSIGSLPAPPAPHHHHHHTPMPPSPHDPYRSPSNYFK